MTLALALSGVVFLVLSIVLAMCAAFADDNGDWKANKNFKIASWTSLGLSVTLFLAAIWTHAITGG